MVNLVVILFVVFSVRLWLPESEGGWDGKDKSSESELQNRGP